VEPILKIWNDLFEIWDSVVLPPYHLQIQERKVRVIFKQKERFFMKNSSRFSILILATFFATTLGLLSSYARAEDADDDQKEVVKEAVKQFEIVDGTNEVEGEPGQDTSGARSKWQKSCDVWKGETKDLNKMNQVVSMSCGSPSCAFQENGTYICSSTAAYKIKIEGVRAPPVPTPPAQVAKSGGAASSDTVVTIGPPQMITEVTPAPQVGFVWTAGFWGWSGHRHIWYPGHWQHERPGYIWIGNQWSRRGSGWHFEGGHWGHHR
jgi:hypothetical protein